MSALALSVDQLLAIEADPSSNNLPPGDTWTVTDTAANLETLSLGAISAMPSVGVTAIAATDTPAVFSANQMNALAAAQIPITVPPNNTSQNDGTYDVPNPNGLTIDITWDSSVASAPASFEAGIEAGVQILEQTILNKITVNIDVGYGEIGGNSLGRVTATPENISEGGPVTDAISYSNLRSDLALVATTNAALTSVSALPNTSSLDGQSNFSIGTAEAKALGLLAPNDSSVDGEIGVSPIGFSGSELVGSALHEITHAMGRTFGASALSLFRYTSPGNNDFTSNIPAAPSYFSIDGGVTKLADFGETSDPSDFLNSPASSLTPNDPFDETIAGSELTPQDLVMLNVLGFQINPIKSFSANYIEALSSSDLGLLASVGVTGIKPLNPLVALDAAQVVAWEDFNAALGTPITILPSGATVALSDSAADIEGMSPGQLDALASIGVSVIAVTDGVLALSFAPAGSGLGVGIIALENPGSTFTAPLSGVDGDDVLELPGSTVLAFNASGSTLQVTTDAGSFDFTNVTYDNPIVGYAEATDTTTDPGHDLVAITFVAGPNIVITTDTVILPGAFAGDASFTAGDPGTLQLNQPSLFTGTIFGFVAGDEIDLPSAAYTGSGTATLATGNKLQISEGGQTYVLQLDPTANYTGATFLLTPDGDGGTDVSEAVTPLASGDWTTVSWSIGTPPGSSDDVLINNSVTIVDTNPNDKPNKSNGNPQQLENVGTVRSVTVTSELTFDYGALTTTDNFTNEYDTFHRHRRFRRRRGRLAARCRRHADQRLLAAYRQCQSGAADHCRCEWSGQSHLQRHRVGRHHRPDRQHDL